jgi:hypothetical protein
MFVVLTQPRYSSSIDDGLIEYFSRIGFIVHAASSGIDKLFNAPPAGWIGDLPIATMQTSSEVPEER